MWKPVVTSLLLTAASPAAQACDIALLLAVDVSGSVDPVEYRVQMDGLAMGLRDSVVAEALVRSGATVSLIQWTGTSRQAVTIPWTSMDDFDDVEILAQKVETAQRKWRNFATAIGEALETASATFASVPTCKRRVIDVSGDGTSNEGAEPSKVQSVLQNRRVTVNALVIETDDTDLTGYFWENVITGDGAFVVTANGFDDYPKRIRQKLIREISKQLAGGFGVGASRR